MKIVRTTTQSNRQTKPSIRNAVAWLTFLSMTYLVSLLPSLGINLWDNTTTWTTQMMGVNGRYLSLDTPTSSVSLRASGHSRQTILSSSDDAVTTVTAAAAAAAAAAGGGGSGGHPPIHYQIDRQEEVSLTTTTMTNTIPHHLLFVDTQRNILETGRPLDAFENIQNTIERYKQLWWKDGDVSVSFLSDPECLEAIAKLKRPTLLKLYKNDSHESDKSDLCRAAALYQTGGYYIDNDIKVIEPFAVDDKENFGVAFVASTSIEGGGSQYDSMSNAFLAVPPKSPFIHDMLMFMDRLASWEDGYRNGTVSAAGTIAGLETELAMSLSEYVCNHAGSEQLTNHWWQGTDDGDETNRKKWSKWLDDCGFYHLGPRSTYQAFLSQHEKAAEFILLEEATTEDGLYPGLQQHTNSLHKLILHDPDNGKPYFLL